MITEVGRTPSLLRMTEQSIIGGIG